LTAAGIEIRTVTSETDLVTSVLVIRKAFRTIADEFKLTKENCPAHPSFMTLENLMDRIEKGLSCFGLFDHAGQIGFVGVRPENSELFHLEKLAVLPEFRRRGYGRDLVDHVFSFAKASGAKRISIDLINNSEALKRWYHDYGFRETGTRTFPHLPFDVCIMQKDIA
jgi:diamine N-acetyltransferase